MRNEMVNLKDQLIDAYEGDPWFGRAAKQLLAEVDSKTAFIKLNNQHSIVELVWHMITWREFTINCLQHSSEYDLKYFEALDWREIDHSNEALWPEALEKLDETQNKLITLFQDQDDALLDQNVKERNYNYRKLLTGIIQHDVYHLGQIAFINKQINND